ncbi:hypothetical protein [Lichenihabitans psoromatis]|uniref:hypothetical protein n=1 Tax=Lichenihabitans psoromatis TaxID=2528642 RepID=UPI001035BAFB|nr:hypothetical protein [Lichenihabitans psoromatis]
MKIMLMLVGAVLLLVGVVWALQGMNYIGGSFMSGQPRWLTIGIATAIVGVILMAVGNRRRSPRL